ncbi:hypothetical protein BS47DRAFT_1459020 [Hydnum rufescens UP504]|uniref:Uncharacterized protein n=1 Tax=Hydnum rufescens UP504 TaxID=1448309 RepID=A0A9P6DW14_9AGAM|nr:hypothetical protein BS47DRAFT_1459020 [Hydnum rufescens UP504]
MTFQGASVFPLAWVQALGCLVMGLAFGLREPITKFYPPLYTAITTGFCGSLTTFSSWNLSVFLAFSNPQEFHRGRLYDIIDGIAQICATLAVSIGSLALGIHLASNIDRRVSLKSPPPYPYLRHSVAYLSFLSYGLVIILYFVLPHGFRPDAMAALLFCYPGALSRHILGTLFNPFLANFPLGTFGANISATILQGVFRTLQRNPSLVNSISTCVLLQGLEDGYCCTFAVEIRTLRHRAGLYIFASVLAAQLALVLTVGIPWWTGSVNENIMCHLRSGCRDGSNGVGRRALHDL